MSQLNPIVKIDKEVYFGGENVTGKVCLSVEKDKKARKVTIGFVGHSVTAWEGGRENRKQLDKTGKKGEQIHVDLKHQVWSPENEENLFPSGEYEWQFSFELPKECPQSFEGRYGFIRYFVSVTIDIPHWPDKIVEKAFTVSPCIDLNSIPGAGDPVHVESLQETKAFGKFQLDFWPFYAGKINLKVNLPTLGYVSGQTITVTGTMENRTSQPADRIIAYLTRTITYYENKRHGVFRRTKGVEADKAYFRKYDWEMCTAVDREIVPPGGSRDFSIQLEIPAVISTIRGSEFVSIEYTLKVAAELQTFVFDRTSQEINIIVGNVPLLKPGCTEMPPHTFVKGESAQIWNTALKEGFTPVFPYFGSAREEQ